MVDYGFDTNPQNMPKKELMKKLGRKDIPRDFGERFEILEKLYKHGKVTLKEVSALSEVSVETLAAYFNEKEDDLTATRTIFVAGGAGFIGSNFVRYIFNRYKNYHIINYDKLTYAGNPDNIRDIARDSRYTFIQGDISDASVLNETFETYQPDFVINFAAETHVGRSVFLGVKEFVNSNVMGVVHLLEAVRNYKTPRFVHISTDETYGTLEIDDSRLFTEESPFLPNVPYAAAKAGGDLMCRAFYQSFKVPVIVTHASNNYGAYQYPEKAIPFWTLQALNDEPLPIHGKGQHVRDWLYVEDHCRALDLVLHKGTLGQVYNIGGQSERTILDAARLILKILGKPRSLITFIEDRPGNDVKYALDIKKIKNELAWEPTHEFEKTLPRVLDWYQENPRWVKGVFNRAKQFNAYVG